MDMLAFVAKTIGATARVGAAVALGALLVAILRGMKVEPLASIDKSIYGAIIAAGIIGFCTVVVEPILRLVPDSDNILAHYRVSQFRTGRPKCPLRKAIHKPRLIRPRL
jgi:hypothetical protein